MEQTELPRAITQEPRAVTQEPIVITPQPTVNTQEPTVIKEQPLTITKNPARVVAGMRTAELMRKRRLEAKHQEEVISKPKTLKLSDPWLTYALGGISIVGIIVFITKHFNNKTVSSNEPKPNIFIME